MAFSPMDVKVQNSSDKAWRVFTKDEYLPPPLALQGVICVPGRSCHACARKVMYRNANTNLECEHAMLKWFDFLLLNIVWLHFKHRVG